MSELAKFWEPHLRVLTLFRNIEREQIMVVDDTISQALNRIADALEENNETLKKILGHYNEVVPPMKENTDRSNRLGRVVESQEMRENGYHN